jgi:hypothetical protein
MQRDNRSLNLWRVDAGYAIANFRLEILLDKQQFRGIFMVCFH